MAKRELRITAYEAMRDPPEIQPAERARQWMDETDDRFAYRCLPLAIANQIGWDILCPVSFTARWNGKPTLNALKIKFHEQASSLVGSHFGSGVLTFTLGYLFRTSPAHDLWVKGPPNLPKDGIAPLEGVVETDWAPFTFTMNWKFTRPRQKVTFEKGEPICRILPYPREYATEFEPVIDSIHRDRQLYEQYTEWRESRLEFIEDLKKPQSHADKVKWQRDYMKGQDMAGKVFSGHQTKIGMKAFRKPDAGK